MTLNLFNQVYKSQYRLQSVFYANNNKQTYIHEAFSHRDNDITMCLKAQKQHEKMNY